LSTLTRNGRTADKRVRNFGGLRWGGDGVEMEMGMGMINAAEIAFGFASEQQLQWSFLTAG